MSDVLLARARRMRREPTEAERRLWLILRGRRFADYKFRRQVPLGPFILYFVCFERRLIVEADGSQHADNDRDAARDTWLVAQGFRVRRFWNADILRTPDVIAETIWSDLETGPSPSSGAAHHLFPRG